MYWFSKAFVLLLTAATFFLLAKSSLHAQDCSLRLSGYVLSGASQEPLIAATVQWTPTGQVVLTDEAGYFEFANGCAAEGWLELSYLGYEAERHHLHWTRDSSLRLTLTPELFLVDPVLVTTVAPPDQATYATALEEERIVSQTGATLAGMLEALPGVSQLQNGTHIAKPIVHGLYGNRLTLLNNGIAQSGQQWGNDHGPEIDPLSASRLSVVEGAQTVQYPSANMGSLVLIEPTRIGPAPDWLAKGTYTLHTNGWGHGLHAAVQQAHPSFSWRLNGTFQRGGDQATPDYWLRNTGQQLASGALQLERQWGERFFTELYVSTYNAELGVLRGSHVGNLTDLRAAFDRSEPFFTEPRFSYGLEAPRQRVHHHLAKLKVRQTLSADASLTYTLSAQLNDRQEYDVRRGGRTRRPALSLLQGAYFGGVEYRHTWGPRTSLSTGIQSTTTDNTNQPGTGILPLIPDYRAFEAGAFALLDHQWRRSRWELGLRYDWRTQSVAAISRDLPRRILRYRDQWHTYHLTAGWKHRLTKDWNVWTTVGYAARPPAINELYSQGLHQGVSGIEEGDVDLAPERMGHVNLGMEGDVLPWLSLEVLGYAQWFDGYIYLQPTRETRLTIRGAFPVFSYQQTAARLLGSDATVRVHDRAQRWSYAATYSHLRGDDLAEGLPIVNLPPNNLRQHLEYRAQPRWTWGASSLTQCRLRISHRYTWAQYHLEAEQDFLPPPSGYHLFGASLHLEGVTQRTQWRLWCRIDNALNATYRDYLNRQRYFANAPGRSVTVGLHFVLERPTDQKDKLVHQARQ